MKRFENAYKKLREAELRLADAVERDFPVGATIFYNHGNYERRGEIMTQSNDRVRIETPSHKGIWIDAYRITGVEK